MPHVSRNFPARSRLGVAVLLLAVAISWVAKNELSANPFNAPAVPILHDDMGGESPVLRLLTSASSIRVISQTIQRDSTGKGGAEHIILSAPPGVSAPLAYNLPPVSVIAETKLVARVVCSRPGVQLAAMVVLPRSIDSRTGKPREVLLRSGKTAPAGNWQEITVDDLPTQLADQARIVRAQRQPADEHEAYVSQVVVLAPGGPGVTEIWVDDISVQGVIARRPDAVATTQTSAVVQPVSSNVPAPNPVADSTQQFAKPPAVPRVIQWQGEPFELLRTLGFDAIWLGRTPTDGEQAEALRLGLLLVCPPPAASQMKGDLKRQFPAVMTWDLGPLDDPAGIEPVDGWRQALLEHQAEPARPAMLRPSGMVREASRVADLVLVSRPTLGSTRTWPEQAAWLGQQSRLVRPGTPIWAGIETQASRRFSSQIANLRSGAAAAVVPASFQQLSMATTAALCMMPRGFCFQSQASLAGNAPENRMRALALELTNLRLGLIDPWVAAGKTPLAARSTWPEVTGLLLKTERSHLIIPLRWAAHQPISSSAAKLTNNRSKDPDQLCFDLPGVPETSEAYLISISGSHRVPGHRVTGGLRVCVENLPDDAFLLITEDGFAYSHVERYLREHAPRAAQAHVELASLRRQQVARALAALPALRQVGSIGQSLAIADTKLNAANEFLQRRESAAAFASATEAEKILETALDASAAAMMASEPNTTFPTPVDWSTLAEIARVAQIAAQSSSPRQPMPGGEFENLNELLADGWRRLQHATLGIETAVRLSPEAPARGSYCLELEVKCNSTDGVPPPLATPPVWATSPPLKAPPGHLLEITGWVRVADVPIGSPDPLLVFDSVGGEESAVRLSSAPSWTPFRLIRVPAAGSEVRLTIALGGVGKAQIDSLAYRFIPFSNASSPR
jgi:hypothetical protein